MSVDKQFGKFVYECDECGDTFETEETDFYEALARVKEEGWLVTRDSDDQEWLHICNECTKTWPHT